MSVGLTALTNRKLLKELQDTYWGGIFNTQQFIEAMKEGEEFFTVQVYESGAVYVSGPYKFIKLIESPQNSEFGYRFEAKGISKPPDYHSVYDLKGFVNDLFWGGKACFRTEAIANLYVSEIKKHRRDLFSEI